jgi:hypothetical protein
MSRGVASSGSLFSRDAGPRTRRPCYPLPANPQTAPRVPSPDRRLLVPSGLWCLWAAATCQTPPLSSTMVSSNPRRGRIIR